MTLAAMVRCDRNALRCDFAETYHVLDYRELPATTAAALAVGLRSDSRIMLKMSGVSATTDTLLRALAVDRLSLLVWAQTKDGQHNRNRPKSIAEILTSGTAQTDTSDAPMSFSTGEELMAARAKFLRREEEEDDAE